MLTEPHRDSEETATLYVPAGSKELYATAPNWENFKNIEEYSFADISSVKTDSNAPAEQIYGIDGKRHDSLRRGLNIVRSSGKVRKVMKN